MIFRGLDQQFKTKMICDYFYVQLDIVDSISNKQLNKK
jgi:hypothetical protein